MTVFTSLYTDEDVANLVSILLSSRGFDVLTTFKAEMSGQSDEQQLVYAASVNRCILTHNRVDFERLHLSYVEAGREHRGIIVTPQNNAYEIARRVSILLNALAVEEVRNQLLYG
ncbi:MAG: DUF5615 family PIN-like protein [Tildeniella torsiva UHER 1998/13D]|jgi:hypothetical protein|nr:DUF5615 family PIN-like protein [Tildeniella torsiva UHER 1998/13D]